MTTISGHISQSAKLSPAARSVAVSDPEFEQPPNKETAADNVKNVDSDVRIILSFLAHVSASIERRVEVRITVRDFKNASRGHDSKHPSRDKGK